MSNPNNRTRYMILIITATAMIIFLNISGIGTNVTSK